MVATSLKRIYLKPAVVMRCMVFKVHSGLRVNFVGAYRDLHFYSLIAKYHT